MDRYIHERSVRFWTVVGGISGLLALIVAIVVALNGNRADAGPSTSSGSTPTASAATAPSTTAGNSIVPSHVGAGVSGPIAATYVSALMPLDHQYDLAYYQTVPAMIGGISYPHS